MSTPHDLEAERAVLGAILVRPSAFREVVDLLAPDDFFRQANQVVYQTMCLLAKKRSPIDFITIKDVLEQNNTVESVGMAYLSGLTDGVPKSTNVTAYAQVVTDHADRRKLMALCQEAIQALPDDAPESVASRMVESVRGAVRVRGAAGDRLGDILTSAMAALDEKEEVTTTGIEALDRLGCGFRMGEFTILAGRPSHGKTALALHLARAAAHKVPVYIASLEMTKDALALRCLAADAKVAFGALRESALSQTEYTAVARSLETLGALPITIDDHASVNLADLRRAMVAQPGLLIVDYVQLLPPPPGTASQNRVQQVGALSRGLKAIAHDLKCSVLALSQLNRQVEYRSGEPQSSDLKESGDLEQDADRILLITRPYLFDDSELPDRCIIKVSKHRNGPLGRVELVFDVRKQLFRVRLPSDPQPATESSDDRKMKSRF
jgi:replicative DNA helicase